MPKFGRIGSMDSFYGPVGPQPSERIGSLDSFYDLGEQQPTVTPETIADFIFAIEVSRAPAAPMASQFPNAEFAKGPTFKPFPPPSFRL